MCAPPCQSFIPAVLQVRTNENSREIQMYTYAFEYLYIYPSLILFSLLAFEKGVKQVLAAQEERTA